MDNHKSVHLQTKEAATLLDMEAWQIQSYAKQGFVESSNTVSGAGSRRTYDEIGLLKLALLNQLTSDGFDIRTVREIFGGLFEFPEDSNHSPAELLRNFFSGKVLITAHQFRMRKLVRFDRLVAVLGELRSEHEGLYIINIGSIVDSLLGRLSDESD